MNGRREFLFPPLPYIVVYRVTEHAYRVTEHAVETFSHFLCCPTATRLTRVRWPDNNNAHVSPPPAYTRPASSLATFGTPGCISCYSRSRLLVPFRRRLGWRTPPHERLHLG